MAINLKIEHWFPRTIAWLEHLENIDLSGSLDQYGQMGVDALAQFTPKETGVTAASWAFTVETNSEGSSITWYNTNEPEGENVAILLQYGHGTGTGGYVAGEDYINPAMEPVFNAIREGFIKEVSI